MSIQAHPRYNLLQTAVQALVTAIRNRQAEYFLWKGYYFHGPRIPKVGVLDGRTSEPIPYGERPEGRPDSWADFDSVRFNAATRVPFFLSIAPYVGPEGHGWVLTVELYLAGLGMDAYGMDGEHWVYRHHEGPEQRVGVWDEWHIEPEE